mmetsp:Transcript_17477/g.43305  ORF Transcript_17477/g.43305 Transcript_17477/m.43305 type:complete len:262 (+) Transcript_17477:508-1293(+)
MTTVRFGTRRRRASLSSSTSTNSSASCSTRITIVTLRCRAFRTGRYLRGRGSSSPGAARWKTMLSRSSRRRERWRRRLLRNCWCRPPQRRPRRRMPSSARCRPARARVSASRQRRWRWTQRRRWWRRGRRMARLRWGSAALAVTAASTVVSDPTTGGGIAATGGSATDATKQRDAVATNAGGRDRGPEARTRGGTAGGESAAGAEGESAAGVEGESAAGAAIATEAIGIGTNTVDAFHVKASDMCRSRLGWCAPRRECTFT